MGSTLDLLGRTWIAALQITVLPLVLSQAVLAVLKTERLGVIGLKTVALFVALMVVAGVFTLLITPPLLALYPVDPETLAALRAGVSAPDAASGAGTGL